MNRHQQLIFLLGMAYLTIADVPSSTNDNSDTKIIYSRRVSRTEPPIQSESSTQSKLPLQEELASRDQSSSQGQLSTECQLTTRCEFTTRSEPTTQCEFTNRSEPTTRCELTARVENSTSVPCSDEDYKESTIPTLTTVGLTAVADRLRDRVMRLTNQMSKEVAALHTAQQLERKMSALEREKYSYLKTASDKVLCVVDKMLRTEKGSAANTSRERQVQQRHARKHLTQSRSRRKLQKIRQLLAGAEVGLVHIESSRMLKECRANSGKPQSTQHSDKSPSRNHSSDV